MRRRRKRLSQKELFVADKYVGKNFEVSSRAIVSARAFVKGTANKYFEKMSIAVKT